MRALKFWAAYLVLLVLGFRAFMFLFGVSDEEMWSAWDERTPL